MTAARSIDPSTSALQKGLAALLAQPGSLVMGVLNITPDSFSDGGRYLDAGAALAQAKKMIGDGAAIIDVGAESTRPYGGREPVTAAEELARLEPVLADLVRAWNAGLDRHHEGRGRTEGNSAGRRHAQ